MFRAESALAPTSPHAVHNISDSAIHPATHRPITAASLPHRFIISPLPLQLSTLTPLESALPQNQISHSANPIESTPFFRIAPIRTNSTSVTPASTTLTKHAPRNPIRMNTSTKHQVATPHAITVANSSERLYRRIDVIRSYHFPRSKRSRPTSRNAEICGHASPQKPPFARRNPIPPSQVSPRSPRRVRRATIHLPPTHAPLYLHLQFFSRSGASRLPRWRRRFADRRLPRFHISDHSLRQRHLAHRSKLASPQNGSALRLGRNRRLRPGLLADHLAQRQGRRQHPQTRLAQAHEVRAAASRKARGLGRGHRQRDAAAVSLYRGGGGRRRVRLSAQEALCHYRHRALRALLHRGRACHPLRPVDSHARQVGNAEIHPGAGDRHLYFGQHLFVVRMDRRERHAQQDRQTRKTGASASLIERRCMAPSAE